ncbi:hypothetical protein K469DRAFT_386000 [Zopfia rhizophila CBS 207.26]|uniref:Uncharacterized protein n=1 Tax=Zopfia rhizophila CBS 207.26 TaxID=1314779 RepID=A0A6A6EHA3_9PEZI|nr:hypothetical protein K469DRAFT_386000 [Zopfia rhizophila CBS 207.26]
MGEPRSQVLAPHQMKLISSFCNLSNNMSAQRSQGRATGAADVSQQEQASIITLRKISGRKFGEIADDLGVPESTASTVYYRARNRAGGDDIHAMLASIPPQSDRPGKKPKVENGSELSSRMRKAIIDKGDQKIVAAVRPVLQEVGINKLNRRQVENVAKEHRDPEHDYAIIRKVRPKKSKLDEEDKKQRVDYSQWLIDEYNLRFPKLIFVCYDETSKPFRGTNNRGGKQKISAPRGRNVDLNNFAVHVDSPRFSLMICAAVSSYVTCSYERPCIT